MILKKKHDDISRIAKDKRMAPFSEQRKCRRRRGIRCEAPEDEDFVITYS